MPYPITCPSCGATRTAPDIATRLIRCHRCRTAFAISPPELEVAEVLEPAAPPRRPRGRPDADDSRRPADWSGPPWSVWRSLLYGGVLLWTGLCCTFLLGAVGTSRSTIDIAAASSLATAGIVAGYIAAKAIDAISHNR